MKRNVIYILIAVFCLSVLSGCGGTTIKTVKNGHFQIYPDLSIGEAVKKMESSGIDTVWNKEKLQNGNTIVSLSFENEDFLEYTFDFLVKKEGGEFRLRSVDIDGKTVESQSQIIDSMKMVMENYGEVESLPVKTAKTSETTLFEYMDYLKMGSSDLYYLNPGVYDEIKEAYDYSKVQEALIDSTRMTLEEFGELGHVLTEKEFRDFLFQRLNRKTILEIKKRVNAHAESVNNYAVNRYKYENAEAGKDLSFHDDQASEYYKEVVIPMINDIPNSRDIKILDARRRILENKEYRSQVPLIKEVNVSWDWDYKEYGDEFLVYLFWDILYYKKLYDSYRSKGKDEEKTERTTFTFVIEKNEDNDFLVRGGTDVFQKVDYSLAGWSRIRIETDEVIFYDRIISYSEGLWPYITTILSYQAWKENGSPVEEMFDSEKYFHRMVESITNIVSASWTNPSQQEDSTVSANTDTSETTEGFRTLVKADSSSYFTEASTSYVPENLIDSENPWVEGVDGDGIGESLTLLFDRPVGSLTIINGFRSAEKPELFQQNGRVKEFMVSFTSEDGTSVDKLYPLEDTPSEQIINFPEGTTSAKIELKIISVYPGSEWSDTCITQIRGK